MPDFHVEIAHFRPFHSGVFHFRVNFGDVISKILFRLTLNKLSIYRKVLRNATALAKKNGHKIKYKSIS